MVQRILKFSFLIIAVALSISCRSSFSKKQKAVDAKQEERKAETQAAYDAAIERHVNIQNKETKKRMEKNRKEAKEKNKAYSKKKKRLNCAP